MENIIGMIKMEIYASLKEQNWAGYKNTSIKK